VHQDDTIFKTTDDTIYKYVYICGYHAGRNGKMTQKTFSGLVVVF